MAEVELPPGIALAWGVQDRPSRGPKRALSLDRILAAGIEIAVRDGLDAVSMSRVAEGVGVSTMALYRYVPTKADLVELMSDVALGPPPAAPAGETWRAGLRRWAEGIRDAYRANPWTLYVPISGPPVGPNNIRWLENGLAALRGTPLGTQHKLSTVLLVSGFVRSEETLLNDIVSTRDRDKPRDYQGLLNRLTTEQEFPEVRAAIAADALDDDDGLDGEFDFGLERILDGVATLIRASRRRRDP
jgi:AcrR family transcriptional regulator